MIQIYADYGPADDPVYIKLVLMVSATLTDVQLAEDTVQISIMQVSEEDKRALVYVVHDRSYDDPDFTDALMALLNKRAPAVSWYVVPSGFDDEEIEVSINIIGAYNTDMPTEAVTVGT